jgi:hypothetical protein
MERLQLTDPKRLPLLGEFTIRTWGGGNASGREASDAPISCMVQLLIT